MRPTPPRQVAPVRSHGTNVLNPIAPGIGGIARLFGGMPRASIVGFRPQAHVAPRRLHGVRIFFMPYRAFFMPRRPGVTCPGDQVIPPRSSVASSDDSPTCPSFYVMPPRSKATPLQDGVTSLRPGAIPLRLGVTPLRDGVTPLRDEVTPLQDGVTPLRDGVMPLRDGVMPLRVGVMPRKTSATPGKGRVMRPGLPQGALPPESPPAQFRRGSPAAPGGPHPDRNTHHKEIQDGQELLPAQGR